MPVCFLHVGTHKTGTSAIQAFLRDHRDVLRARGVLVPSIGMGPQGAHHQLTRALGKSPVALTHEGAVAALEREIEEHPAHALLISSEWLEGHFEVGAGSPIVEFFRHRGFDIELICAVRPQTERLNSAYVQGIKRFKRDHELSEYWADLQVRAQLVYSRWLTIAEQLHTGLHLLPYNAAMREQGAVASLLRVLALVELAAGGAECRKNRTLGTAGVAAVRTCQQRLKQQGLVLTRRQQRRCANELANADAQQPTPPFYGLTPELVRQIESRYREDNDLLAKRAWGATWRDVFGSPEPRTYNQVDPRDPNGPHFTAYEAILERSWPRVRSIARNRRLRERDAAQPSEPDGDHS